MRNCNSEGGRPMRKLLVGLGSLAVAVTAATSAQAQDTVKVGLIAAFTGQFADTALMIEQGAKLYIKRHGDTVAGKKVVLISKDSGGPDAAKAAQLAQELVTRDGADILAGFTLTPEALGAAGVSEKAKKFMVNMNAATSVVITKSPYMVRTSVTLPMIASTMGKWAATKGGVKKAYPMVAD